MYHTIPGKFLAEPRRVVAEILRVVDDAVNQAVTRQDLISSLASRGYKLRQLRYPQHAGAALQKATDERYLAHAKRRLIRRSLLKRPAAEEVLERLTGTSSDSVITGSAGSGKTACVIQVAESLRQRQIPVLVFRIDRLHPHLTTRQLGEHLGLEESPALVLAAAAEAAGGQGVLIIDQLDAISTMSGRSTGVFELVEQLLLEARDLRESTSLHIIVVCRSFDLENDSGLRQLIPDSASRVDVSQFSMGQVKSVLTDEGYDLDGFDAPQIELLRLPQNLSLFLGVGFSTDQAPAFRTARDLFDHYWDSKRRSLEEDARSDQWLEAVQTLSDRMTSDQNLSVAKEVLDGVSPVYLDRMTSEGVLTFDGRRYGFGHESFFDYCFSRLFFRRGESLAPMLIGSEQHLFRRAQVRQVLEYLRDSEPSRYIQEVRDLLSEEKIRPHVKDLVLASLADVSEPREDEWAVWKEWIDPELQAIKDSRESPCELSTLAWRHFFGSRSWFTFAERSGTVGDWLAVESDSLADIAVRYLRVHQRQAPERTTALLEPYVDRGGEWPRRLRFFVQRIGRRKSVRLFEFFLRLIDNGTLDQVGGGPSPEITVWDSVHGMQEEHPQWVAELLAHQLRRQLVLLPADRTTSSISGLLGHDPAAKNMLRLSAEGAPSAFVEYVLPAVLELSDATSTGDTGPKPDGVWSFDGGYDTSSLDEACLSGLEGALATLAGRESDLTDIVADLRQRETNTSNRLLLALYVANPRRYGDEAISLLCDEPWRLNCRFRGKRHWYATELVRAALPHCKEGTRRTLEDTFLSYVDVFEGTTSGYKRFGWSQFDLLLAIPEELRSSAVNKRLRELARRFPDSPAPPRQPTVERARSPIDETSAAKMTDEHWLRALRKYSSRGFDDFLSGSYELAGVLQNRTKEEPGRFARLALRFPSNTPPTYYEGVLRGLRESSVESELKVGVCRKALEASPRHCGKTVAHVLQDLESPLSEDAIRILHYLATEHEDPAEESWQKEEPEDGQYRGDEILTCGLNSTRGNAAYAMAKIISEDRTSIDTFGATLNEMIRDRSTAVLSCVLATLTAVARHEPELALQLFLDADLFDDRVLATQHALPLVRLGLREDLAKVRPLIERMLQSSHPEACEIGSTHAGIAALLHPSEGALAKEATQLSSRHRLGLAKVAAANIGHLAYREWCEDQLLRLFEDGDEEVRREAASCFRRLEGSSLDEYENLIDGFSKTAAFESLPGPLLWALERSRRRLPSLTWTTCERFLDAFAGEAARSRRTVTKLVFRAYQQHQTDDWGPRLLDLIDRLCLDGVFEVRDALSRFDR